MLLLLLLDWVGVACFTWVLDGSEADKELGVWSGMRWDGSSWVFYQLAWMMVVITELSNIWYLRNLKC